MSLEFLNGMPSIIFDRFAALNAAETLDCQRAFATECEQKRYIRSSITCVHECKRVMPSIFMHALRGLST